MIFKLIYGNFRKLINGGSPNSLHNTRKAMLNDFLESLFIFILRFRLVNYKDKK